MNFNRSSISSAMLAVIAMGINLDTAPSDMRSLEGPLSPARTSRKKLGLSERERAWKEKAKGLNK